MSKKVKQYLSQENIKEDVMKSQFKKYIIILALIVIRAGAGWAQGGPIVPQT